MAAANRVPQRGSGKGDPRLPNSSHVKCPSDLAASSVSVFGLLYKSMRLVHGQRVRCWLYRGPTCYGLARAVARIIFRRGLWVITKLEICRKEHEVWLMGCLEKNSEEALASSLGSALLLYTIYTISPNALVAAPYEALFDQKSVHATRNAQIGFKFKHKGKLSLNNLV